MSDSDDFFDSAPPPPSGHVHIDSGSATRIEPRPSDSLPSNSKTAENKGVSESTRYSEDQVEVKEARGSKVYDKSHDSQSYGRRSEDVSDTKRVVWHEDEDYTSSESDDSSRQERPIRVESKSRDRKYSDSDESFSDTSSASDPKKRTRSFSGSSASTWDSATDISPLQSPNHTRYKSNPTKRYSDILKPKSKTKSGKYKVTDEDNLDLKYILETILDMESKQQKIPDVKPRQRSRMPQNYSFTDGRIQSIERDNQRLLQRIMDLQQERAPKKKKVPTATLR